VFSVRRADGDCYDPINRPNERHNVYTPTENNEALSRLTIALHRDDAQGIEQAIVMLAQTDSGASILATLTKVCATHVIRSIDLMSIGQ
jgi:acetolactate synthase small subunit